MKNIYDMLNRSEISQLQEDLEDWNEYIPIPLLLFVDKREYFKNWTENAKITYLKVRNEQPINNGKWDYFKKDIIEWVKKYPQFEYILGD